jgi:hypothetical protein
LCVAAIDEYILPEVPQRGVSILFEKLERLEHNTNAVLQVLLLDRVVDLVGISEGDLCHENNKQ